MEEGTIEGCERGRGDKYRRNSPSQAHHLTCILNLIAVVSTLGLIAMETQVLSKANVACPWRANLGLAPGQFGSEVAI